jgi:hypothetical protein
MKPCGALPIQYLTCCFKLNFYTSYFILFLFNLDLIVFSQSHFNHCFSFQFCDVTTHTLVIIEEEELIKIWLQLREEINF